MAEQYADTSVIGGATGNPDQTTGTHDGNMLINGGGGTGQRVCACV